MKTTPTYTANEILEMCLNFELDYSTFKILIDLIDQEMKFYNEGDLAVLMQASMIVFTRSMLKASLGFMK